MKRNDFVAKMTDKQSQCYDLLCALFRGSHHLDGTIRECGEGIEYIFFGSMATWDFDELTRLVVLAHDRCIRAEVHPCTPQMLRLFLHVRERTGSVSHRHPTIEDAMASCRGAQRQDGKTNHAQG
jgi:hypothetical protein